MTNGNDFITPITLGDTLPSGEQFNRLTKREYFAAMAMQGMISNVTITEHTVGLNSRATDKYFIAGLSNFAVQHADALIKALNDNP